MWRLIIILTIWLLSAAPGLAQGCHYIYLPVIWADGDGGIPEMSDWKIIIPESTTNLVLNPSAETTLNFTALGSAAVTRATAHQHYGVYSYQVATTGDNDGISLTLDTLANAIHYVTVRVRGGTLPAWDWSLDDSTYNEPALVEQIDSDWALYGVQFPAAEASGSATLYIRQNGAGSFTFYIDGIQVEQKEYWTTYCDGTQEGCEWDGAENATTSQRSGDSRAGGRVQDLEDDYYLNITGMIDASVSPRDVSIDSYATLPGGELNNIKVSSRVFTLTGVINGTNQNDLHSKKQTLLGALLGNDYPGEQPARLQYHGATTHKQIDAYYEAGLEGDQSGTDPCAWERVAVRLIAPQPYWEEIGESAAVLDTNDSATFEAVAARLRSTEQWDALGPPNAAGTYNVVYAVAEDDTYIYYGGNFLNFDNIANADNIVRWHKKDQVWSALGSGIDNFVRALAIGPDGTLYAGGLFANAGGGAAARIASWDGSTWSALGSGLNSAAYALAIGQDGTLYVGGAFTTAGGGAALRIAAWDGSTWSALSSGMNSDVTALAIGLNGTLYAGGLFTTAGGGSANYGAAWDGSAWSALGSGMDNAIRALVIGPNGTLYAGGAFTTAGGTTANHTALWNGTGWTALGSGMDDDVWSMALGPDGILYAGGTFTTAGGIAVGDRVARWNGSSWAHFDIDLPGSAIVTAFGTGQSDPVVKQKYDLWIGYDTTGSGNFAGLVTVSNDSTVKVFPKAVFSRSGGDTATVISLKNERTGKELFINYALLDGETLTIDLTPTDKSVTSSFFGSRFDAVLSNSDMGQWALLPNSNDVSSFVSVAGGPTITAYLLWKDTYESYD